MGIREFLFGGSQGPTEKQIRRAIKAVTETHGDPSARYSAAQRLIGWATPEALYAVLLRFTTQLPSITLDQAEKEELCEMLVRVGSPLLEPISRYLRVQTDVRWPCEVLRRLVSEEEYTQKLLEVLTHLKERHLRDEEHKARLIQMLPRPGNQAARTLVTEFLENDNDEVALQAIEFLTAGNDNDVRQRLIHLLTTTQERPRVQAWVADLFEERSWSVRPHSSEVERALPESYYLTSKGLIKRRGTAGHQDH